MSNLITMLLDGRASLDGIAVREFKAGETYALEGDRGAFVARNLVAQGLAVFSGGLVSPAASATSAAVLNLDGSPVERDADGLITGAPADLTDEQRAALPVLDSGAGAGGPLVHGQGPEEAPDDKPDENPSGAPGEAPAGPGPAEAQVVKPEEAPAAPKTKKAR